MTRLRLASVGLLVATSLITVIARSWPDATPVHVAVSAILPIGLTALAPVAAAAASQRWWPEAATAGVLAMVGLLMLLSQRGPGPVTPTSTAHPTLRVATANLLADNDQIVEAIAQLAAADADVILLQEVTPENVGLLESAAAVYEHQLLDPRPGYFGSAILSTSPLEGGPLDLAGWPALEATAHVDGRQVGLVNVHLRPPLSRSGHDTWDAQLDALSNVARSTDGPIVVAGDMNATDAHRRLDRIDDVLDDAHELAGTGFGWTFPERGPLRPFLRLDRIYASHHLRPLSTTTLDPSGSDHRPVLTEFEVLDG